MKIGETLEKLTLIDPKNNLKKLFAILIEFFIEFKYYGMQKKIFGLGSLPGRLLKVCLIY
jgi:hypothetical protein